MNDTEIRKKILELLYRAYKKTPGHGEGDIRELAEEIGENLETIIFNAEYLSDNDFVSLGMNYSIEIKPKGVNFVEGPNEFNPRSEYISQSMNIGDINIGGGGRSDIIQNQNIGGVIKSHNITINPSDFLGRMIQEIQNQPDLDQKKKKSWTKALSDMAAHPMILEIFRKALELFRF